MSVIPPYTAANTPPADRQVNAQDIARLREAAIDLEATFLAEMLKSAGVGEMTGAFSGGTGEAQFASFLRQEQAGQMARAGGIGLAEQVFQNLKGRLNG